MAETISHLVSVGVPVMGHVGLMPQRAKALGGFRVQGNTAVKVITTLRILDLTVGGTPPGRCFSCSKGRRIFNCSRSGAIRDCQDCHPGIEYSYNWHWSGSLLFRASTRAIGYVGCLFHVHSEVRILLETANVDSSKYTRILVKGSQMQSGLM